MTKTGNGILELTGSNPFTGGAIISNGTLELGNPNAVEASVVTVNAANGLTFATSGLTYNATGLAGTANFALGDAGGNPLTLNVTGTSNATFYGAMTGGGPSRSNSSGTQVLAGSNTFTGTTTISTGTLQLGNAANAGSLAGAIVDNSTLAFGTGLQQTFAGAISGSGNLAMTGAGVLWLQGSSIGYSGATLVTGGGVLVATTTSVLPNLFVSGSGGVTVSGQGSTLALSAGTNAGEYSLAQIQGMVSNVTFGQGASLGLAIASPETFTVGGGSPAFNGGSGGTLGLAAVGSGTLVVGTGNTYTGRHGGRRRRHARAGRPRRHRQQRADGERQPVVRLQRPDLQRGRPGRHRQFRPAGHERRQPDPKHRRNEQFGGLLRHHERQRRPDGQQRTADAGQQQHVYRRHVRQRRHPRPGHRPAGRQATAPVLLLAR